MTKAKTEAVKVGPFRVAPRIRDGAPTGNWIVDLPPTLAPEGKRQRLTFASKTEAVTEAKRLLRELQLEGALSGSGPKLSGVTFTEFAKHWLDIQKDRVALKQKRPKSLQGDAERLAHLLRHFAASDITKITGDSLRAYQKVAAEERAPASVNAEMRVMKTIMIHAHGRELIKRVPRADPLNEPRKRVDLPTMPEMLAILSHLPPNTARVVRFIAETGCRKGEAFNLEWRDLNPDEGLVTIQDKIDWQAKTASSNRTFPISFTLMDTLMASKEEAERRAQLTGVPMPRYVFPGRKGVRMTSYAKTLANAVIAAGVTRDGQPLHINPHNLRKAFITWQKQRGIDDTFIQPSVGHRPGSPMTARHYTRHDTEALRMAVLDLGEHDFAPASPVRRRTRQLELSDLTPVPDRGAEKPALLAPKLAPSGTKGKRKKA